jgi:hypothetical protein
MALARIEWIDEFVTHLRPERMAEIERAIQFALALND